MSKITNLREKTLMNRGITLIALVITIIVLLILAAVSIATLTGENGILTKTKTAQKETDEATAKEKVQVTVLGSYDKEGNLNFEELKNNLEKEEGISIIEGNEKFPITVSVDSKYIFEIDERGNITYKSDASLGDKKVIVMASDIANSQDKSQYYGATVTGYNCTNSAGVNAWKIFYADKNNIYLITDDYIHYNDCPASVTQAIYKNSNYKLSMNNVIKDYSNGSDHITDSKIQNLNKSYFDLLTTSHTASSNNNMKAVAYMLDTSVWSAFMGEKAEYAIGGATVEMLMKSYSEKYKVDYRARAKDAVGYELSTDGGENWTNHYYEIIDANDSLYVISDMSKANGMWLASPSMNNTNYVLSVYSNGSVDHYNYYYNSYGFRPLVCLSSEVQLEKKEDGSYQIK